MPIAASSPQRVGNPDTASTARGGSIALAFTFALVLASAALWTGSDGDGYAASIRAAWPSATDSDVVVVSLANVGYPTKAHPRSHASDAGHLARAAAIDIKPRAVAQRLRPNFAAAYRSM